MFIIDFQGFQYGSKHFLCKEIALLHVDNGYVVHRFVNLPVDTMQFNSKIRNHMGWLTRNLHGLILDKCDAEYLPYEALADFIKQQVGLEEIAVKGCVKKKWLESFLSNNIVDLFDEGCPALESLKNIFKSFHCQKHIDNSLNCSLENVYFLYHWYIYCKQ